MQSRQSICSDAAISGIADQIGVPLLVEQLTPDQNWREDASAYTDREGRYTNQEATFLFLNIKPTAKYTGGGYMGWGFAPMRWQNDVGSVIIARRDRKPLGPLDVELICVYCRRYVLPLTENATGAGLEMMTEEEVLAKISPSTFAAFKLEYSQKQRELREAGSPSTANKHATQQSLLKEKLGMWVQFGIPPKLFLSSYVFTKTTSKPLCLLPQKKVTGWSRVGPTAQPRNGSEATRRSDAS
ncbi:MAG: hypothetical protein Q9226_008112 [Calogaya cf. arnoldii]